MSSSQGFVEGAVEFGGDDVEVGLGNGARSASPGNAVGTHVAICWGDQRCSSLAATTARSRSQVASFAVVAYATPGSPSQVVVSRGLARVLGADELDAVVRHELAHLRNRHHRDPALAAVVDAALGWVSGLRASTAAARLGIERSAEEEAAERPGAREATRRALLKATETMLAPVPAFTAVLTLLARLDALATPPPIRVSGCGPRCSPPSRGSPPWRCPACWGGVL